MRTNILESVNHFEIPNISFNKEQTILQTLDLKKTLQISNIYWNYENFQYLRRKIQNMNTIWNFDFL